MLYRKVRLRGQHQLFYSQCVLSAAYTDDSFFSVCLIWITEKDRPLVRRAIPRPGCLARRRPPGHQQRPVGYILKACQPQKEALNR
eukprot:scaffold140299_cov22-Prasinocladus_malaysianus.AAC.1